MRTLIIGGGIGGLALAAGLRRHDLDVTVVDRDVDLTATGGYHITLDARAQTALQRLLPPEVVERLLASASALRLREPDAFFDRRGRLLGFGPGLGTDPGVDVDRVTLRLLLADAVGDRLEPGRELVAVERADDGRPLARFADGGTEVADLLVGADGASSAVARHLAGQRTNEPVGVIGFSGRTPVEVLGAPTRRRLGPRSSLAVGTRGLALYAGFLDPVGRAVLDAPDLRASVTTGPTYIWGAMVPEDERGTALRGLDGVALRDALLARFRAGGWSASSLEVVARTQVGGLGAFRFNASPTEPQRLAPWPAGDVTALGDAVHATPPTAGMGAGAAIRDADALLEQLLRVRAGQVAPAVAVRTFEDGMRIRGSEVLRLAMRAVRWIRATDTPLGAAVTTAALPLLAGVSRLRGHR